MLLAVLAKKDPPTFRLAFLPKTIPLGLIRNILKTADCWTFALAKKTLPVKPKPSAILKVKLQPVFSIS